jgi:hypothetical protein
MHKEYTFQFLILPNVNSALQIQTQNKSVQRPVSLNHKYWNKHIFHVSIFSIFYFL